MNFCVRVDDLGWTAAEAAEPPLKVADRGLALAQRFHAAMQGRPYLGAVIPDAIRRDNEALAWLKSKPVGLTVALHGDTHRRAGTVDSEFHAATIDQVRSAIADSQEMLRIHSGGRTGHYVPPFNGTSALEIEALWHEGIRYVWGGAAPDRRHPSDWPTPPQPIAVGRVLFVPSWAQLYGATRWRFGTAPILLDALPSLMDLPGNAVLTLHLPWELSRGGESFDGVREMVDRIGDRIVSPEEFIR